jgi:hypothetical protein
MRTKGHTLQIIAPLFNWIHNALTSNNILTTLGTTNFSSFATLRHFLEFGMDRRVFSTSKMGQKVFKSSSLFRFWPPLLDFHCIFVPKEVLLCSKKPLGPFWIYRKTFVLFPNGPTFPIWFKFK